MSNWCLYRHIRLDKNEVFYIGIGYKKDGKRHQRPHRKSGRNNIWNKIISKTDWKWEIILDDLTLSEAQEKEKEFIKLYGRINLKTGTLSNLTDGGEGVEGLKLSDEVRYKLSLVPKKSGWNHTQETKNKISKSCTGRKLSNETKLKISQSHFGKVSKSKGKSKYNEIETQVFNLLENNISESEICKKLNISKGSLYRLKLKYKEFKKF
jgi:hypothetical protein